MTSYQSRYGIRHSDDSHNVRPMHITILNIYTNMHDVRIMVTYMVLAISA